MTSKTEHPVQGYATREEAAKAYELSHKDASWLAGAVQMPDGIRRQVLVTYLAENGEDALINLFSQFIGMANSVVANCHEAVEIFGLVEGTLHPDRENLNLPTIFGACDGAMLADGIAQNGLCHGCAFRLGTLANQSPSTTCDADWCGHPGEALFMCHDHPDSDEPTKACAGFARLRAQRKRQAA